MITNRRARTALVTGASSGIGAASALALASIGFDVVGVARREDRLARLADEGRSLPSGAGTVHVLPLDLTAEHAASRAVEHAVATTGSIDALVNAAGYGVNEPSEEMAEEDWNSLFAININAVAHLTAAALPHLLDAAREHGVADVLTISSTAGLSAEPRAAAYSGSKFAVRGLMEAWRKEYASRDVRFCTVYPGAVATEFGGDQQFIRDWYADMEARGAVLTATDIASTVAFVVSQPARASISELTLRPARQT
ncbi:SDR family oxidoreductase [Agromyces subbeticus]|uniref:SDR family oxidoreductase n=1 Tax=Agromyces subbeticus TaxID=293890 RepID=UPI0003B754E3|nr:SDR family oxidoreductase [Agromyces subbeticus]